MESFVVVVDNTMPDIENQLEQIKNYLQENKDKVQNQGGIKEKYYKIVQAGYNVFSQLPVEKIRPTLFNVFTSTFNKLVQVSE